jgi:hypothetical protein
MDQSSNSQNVLMIVLIIIFITIFLWTFLTVFSISASNDNAKYMMNAMSNIVIVNLVMVMFFTGIAYWYINANQGIKHAYMMFLLHVNILICITAVSISCLYTISN